MKGWLFWLILTLSLAPLFYVVVDSMLTTRRIVYETQCSVLQTQDSLQGNHTRRC
jgi:heme exporter protein D